MINVLKHAFYELDVSYASQHRPRALFNLFLFLQKKSAPPSARSLQSGLVTQETRKIYFTQINDFIVACDETRPSTGKNVRKFGYNSGGSPLFRKLRKSAIFYILSASSFGRDQS